MKKILLGGIFLAFAVQAPAQVTPKPTISVCKAAYRAPNATYTAKIGWNEQLIYYPGGTLVVGVADTSKAIYIQGTTGSKIDAKGTDTVSFTISDVSAYPLDVAVYSFSATGYKAYQAACKATKQCFFSASSDGVVQVTPAFRLTSAAATPACR